MKSNLTLAALLESSDPKRLGERLQLARKAKGFTQEAVASKLGVARTTLVAIEKGERRVTESELHVLADHFDKEIVDFVNPHAPSADLLVQFRSLLQKRLFPTSETDHLEIATQELQLCAERAVELELLTGRGLKPRYPRPRDIDSGLGLEQEADAAAEEDRQRLGLGDGPIHDLRGVLEDQVGLRIFFFKMHSKIAGLFGYAKELGGCIAINSQHRRERQSMSLAHEYGHVVDCLERPDIQVQQDSGRKSDPEKFAELFGVRFLMPTAGVKRQIRTYLQSQGNSNKLGPRDLVILASDYRVSFEAYVKRLEELRILSGGYYDRLMMENFRPDEAKKILGLLMLESDTQKLPRRHRLLALEAYQKELLSLDELARFLDSDLLATQTLVEQYREYFQTTVSTNKINWDASIKLQ